MDKTPHGRVGELLITEGRQNCKERLHHWKNSNVKISDQFPQRPPISNFKKTVPSDFKGIHFFSSLESRGI